MKLINSRFYGAMMVITDYLLLGLLWLICSFPLITLYGASVSLINVIDQWQCGESGSIMRLFFTKFKEKFISRILISCLFLLSFGVIYFDFSLLSSMFSDDKIVVIGLIVTGLIMALLFVNMSFIDGVTKGANIVELFKGAVISLYTNFLVDLLILLLILSNCFLIFLLPVTVFFTPIISAIGIYKLSSKKKILIHIN
ncbi:DUF624 domain-containing protein [Candidatus Enterococcus ikei]|uniref:DUF624 domain-containing protein n=1 Tax=Candidatus Enterococcus ikei TaxID=2815326 RepID=A0ABS3GXY9_9ENTE|nr:DUF624 domain-containing protein [Enterococcus sp. DIV0869a]MBO0440133.1 DUF624 domain-containing protein [Enterococcus sp. DIV0869a]